MYWSKEIYTVYSISKPDNETWRQPEYRLKDPDGVKVNRVFLRRDLQPIDLSKLQVNTDPKPEYRTDLFNREHFLRVDLPNRPVVPNPAAPPPVVQQEEAEVPLTRGRRKRRREPSADPPRRSGRQRRSNSQLRDFVTE